MTNEVEKVIDVIVTDVQNFLRRESAAGIILIAATVLALIVANTPLFSPYQDFIRIPYWH